MDSEYIKVQQQFKCGITNFQAIIQEIDDKKTYQKALRQASKKYDIKNFKVSNMTPVKARKIYPLLIQKYRQNLAQQQSWLQNQRRLFIWLVLCYLFVSSKSIIQLSFQQFSKFSSIFNNKKQEFLKFQIFALIKKQKKTIKWRQQQDEILLRVLSKQKYQNQQKQWNEISKDFFQESIHKYYRSSKQCRQRWMNHLDPNKIKGTWKTQQDLIILKFVKEKGKKWSQIVKDLEGCKTEHMVKNRFNSMINKKSKETGSRNQEKLINKIIEELQLDENEIKNEEQQFKTSDKQGNSWKSNRSEQINKSQKNQQIPNIFQNDNSNGKRCKFFVQRAGSLSMSQKGGLLPQLANPILQEIESNQERTQQKFLISTPLSQRPAESFLTSSPFITGNGGNITPSLFFLEQNQKGNHLYGSSQFSMSFSSNFDKFIPEKQ